jgi:uncharacterized membrane protein YedE/YeeE
MQAFTPLAATLGGLLLGVASSLLFLANGRILGVSGIVGELPSAPAGDRLWRVVFLAGLLSGGAMFALLRPGALAGAAEQTVGFAIASGVLVGAGTRLGNGCTSGHGLCGIARVSRRSIVATCVFMAAAAATVFVVRHVLHLPAAGAS